MRRDMHKVIVERERRGSRGPFRRGLGEKNTRPDDLPAKQGIRKRHQKVGLRSLNENLSPLKRFLRKQVGRPWDKVYSEISANLRASSAVQQHVRDHVWDFVERHPVLGARGVVYGRMRWGIAQRIELRPGDLYIHPKTGLLAAVKRKKVAAKRKGARVPR